MNKSYTVTIPIAGHLHFDVEAESPEAAKEQAYNLPVEEGDLSWEMLERFNSGNVCYCPTPWNLTVKENK